MKGVRGPSTHAAAATIVASSPARSPGVAAVLSLVIPGAGQMYAGHVGRGLLWLVSVVIGYSMFVLPGLVLHVVCIFMAMGAARESVVD